jgi:hypothetical protein
MAMVIVGLLKDAHQARGLIRALDHAGFSGDDIDMQGGLVADLTLRGVPAEDAQAYAEGVRRGGAIVCVRADAHEEAEEAAELMLEHGALDVDACRTGWRGTEPGQPEPPAEHYASAFGEYPSAPGRIYADARARRQYTGPERRVRDEPHGGDERRSL